MVELKDDDPPVEPLFWFSKAHLYHSEDYNLQNPRRYNYDIVNANISPLIFPKISIDAYCPSCKRETVFYPVGKEDERRSFLTSKIEGIYFSEFVCTRIECSSGLYFVFLINKGIVTKIGQFPSIADLIEPKIKKYGSVLDSKQITDWQRGIGLHAHNIGAGAYVYLRRIIENLINDASVIAIKDNAIKEEEYSKARWPEKIKMLSKYLPSYLFENAKVYSVLSKGIHELSEEDCLDYFPIINTSIEIICEEKLAALEQKKKRNSGAKALQKVYQKMSEEDEQSSS
jgi:hypothetical protein